jgi:uncharacterized membrane protein
MQALSGIGITLGTLLFAAALTPTLVPRTYWMQGILAGICFAIGYASGVFLRWLWHYLELPELPARLRSRINGWVAGACLATGIVFLHRATQWQNSIRAAVAMDPVDTAHPFKVCAIAAVVFLVLLVFAWLFRLMVRWLSSRIQSFVPAKVANIAGAVVVILLVWSIANNFLVRSIFHMLDSSYREFDALLEPERPQPVDPGKTGSAASLARWQELGRTGRGFVASAPAANEISAFTQRPAREPIRVYVGLRGADTPQARARLALQELKRQNGFDRSMLVIVTPTGTGWIDPSAMDTVEYLHDGDVASVAVQYSYLNSPLSLLVQPEYGAETARALFAEIYAHWTSLPRDKRPRLYVHGLSLGAMHSEQSAELLETIGDPIDGALWSGPPFASRVWKSVTENRNAGSAAWLPVFRDGRFIRFMNQNGSTLPAGAPWGAMRVVYLQYASDSVVFFSYQSAWRRPAWMNEPRGPDVSPALRWYPVVTMLQLAVDMMVATSTPMGYGHVYAPAHYVDAWVAVTDVRHWSSAELARLKRHLANAAGKVRDGANGDDGFHEDRGG